MKKSRKCQETRNRNTHKNSASTLENPVSTSKVSTREARTDMRIPKKSEIHHFLYVDTKGDSTPKWRLLDALLAKAKANSEDQAARIFEAFVSSIAVFYPEKRERIEKLRALILWHILEGDDLTEEYWKKLREL